MNLMVAGGMEPDQIRQVVVLVVSVPVMQFDILLDLNHLPTARADPLLLAQDLSTKRGADARNVTLWSRARKYASQSGSNGLAAPLTLR